MSDQKKSINILGATGSIGCSAVDVILANPDHFDVHAVSANENAQKLAETAIALKARSAVIVRDDKRAELEALLSSTDIEVFSGVDGLNAVSKRPVDVTLAAIVGMAGLESIMNAIRSSKAVAIANKEPLVSAGALVMTEARAHNTTILPVDSEHNAIFQVFDFERKASINKIIITASGGPFRTWSLEEMGAATVEQALAHPNWSMGDKISIDSATMVNKALEVIEAHYLFDLPPEQIEVLIHPQSIVHSMVEYCDGSVLSQMGASDMRTPIANVLAWPERLETPGQRLNLAATPDLSFDAPDLERFPALAMAYDCIKRGGYACAAFNAANEVAVDAFLNNKIGFLGILDCISYALEFAEGAELPTVKDVQNYDQDIRSAVLDYINNEQKTKAKLV